MRDFDFVITQHVQQIAAWNADTAGMGVLGSDVRARANEYAGAVLVPMSGEAIQKRGSRGLEPDGFTLQRAAFRFEALRDLQLATIVGFIPEAFGGEVDVRVSCRTSVISTSCVAGELFTCAIPIEIESRSESEFEIALSRTYRPSAVLPGNRDMRDLGCIIVSVDFR